LDDVTPTHLPHLPFARIEGLEAEFEIVFPKHWSIEYRDRDYVVRAFFDNEWRTIIWSAVMFLSYDHMSVLRRIPHPDVQRCYEFISSNGHGLAFRMTFLMIEEHDAQNEDRETPDTR